jgi:hypothetical protein
MPLTVKFRDIEKDILDAVRCGRYEDTSNLDTELDNGDESDRDEDSDDDGDFMTMRRHQLPNHGKGIPLRALAPDSGANLLSPALLDMLSDIPHAADIDMTLRDNDMSVTDHDFTGEACDDLEKAFADW